jgi:hypothetical protein
MRNANALATVRVRINSAARNSHRNRAWWRSSAPCTINPPASQETRAHSVATWNSLGTSSSVVLRSSASSRSYSPKTFAPASRIGRAATLAHVSCSDLEDSAIVTRKAVRIAIVSATTSVLRKIESRSMPAEGPLLCAISGLLRSVPSGPTRRVALALPPSRATSRGSAISLSIAPCPTAAPKKVDGNAGNDR